jgi:hypothetical protein
MASGAELREQRRIPCALRGVSRGRSLRGPGCNRPPASRDPSVNWTAQEIERAFAEAGIAGLPASALISFLPTSAAAALERPPEPDRHSGTGTNHPPPFRGVRLCSPASSRRYRKLAGLRLGGGFAGDPDSDLPSRDPGDAGRVAGKEGIVPAGGDPRGTDAISTGTPPAFPHRGPLHSPRISFQI